MAPTASQPLLLDAFCCEGGASVGYARAGFLVEGVDIKPTTRYPFELHIGDAVTFILDHGHRFDAISASPPCQKHTTLSHRTGKTYEDFIEATRDALVLVGKPWVIENVPRAPLVDPVILCGTHFGLHAVCDDGMRRDLWRHRHFESSFPLAAPGPCVHTGQPVGVYGHGGSVGTQRGYSGNKAEAAQAMGIDWTTRAGLSQAIPPAYAEHVGRALIAHL